MATIFIFSLLNVSTMHSKIYNWLHGKHYIYKSGACPITTHVCLGSSVTMTGPISIPDHSLSGFYKELMRLEFEEAPFYLVERAKPIHPLVLDLDIIMTQNCIVDKNNFKYLAAFVCQQVSKLYAKPGMCYVGGCTPTLIKKVDKKTKIIKTKHKMGIHMFWPDLPVDAGCSMYIRSELLKVLTDEHRVIPGSTAKIKNSWGDVVDEAVCKNASCRMWGAGKLMNCSCLAKPCDHGIKGKINGGREYKIMFVLNEDGTKNIDETRAVSRDLKYLYLVTSLRQCSKATKSSKYPEEFKISTKKKIKIRPSRVIKKRKLSAKSSETVNECIERLVAFNYPNAFRYIKSIKPSPGKNGKISSIIVSFDSKCCPNVGTDHSSNNTYLIIDKSYMTKRCHSTNTNGGRIFQDSCNKFHQKTPTPPAMAKKIFGCKIYKAFKKRKTTVRSTKKNNNIEIMDDMIDKLLKSNKLHTLLKNLKKWKNIEREWGCK